MFRILALSILSIDAASLALVITMSLRAPCVDERERPLQTLVK